MSGLVPANHSSVNRAVPASVYLRHDHVSGHPDLAMAPSESAVTYPSLSGEEDVTRHRLVRCQPARCSTRHRVGTPAADTLSRKSWGPNLWIRLRPLRGGGGALAGLQPAASAGGAVAASSPGQPLAGLLVGDRTGRQRSIGAFERCAGTGRRLAAAVWSMSRIALEASTPTNWPCLPEAPNQPPDREADRVTLICPGRPGNRPDHDRLI